MQVVRCLNQPSTYGMTQEKTTYLRHMPQHPMHTKYLGNVDERQCCVTHREGSPPLKADQRQVDYCQVNKAKGEKKERRTTSRFKLSHP